MSGSFNVKAFEEQGFHTEPAKPKSKLRYLTLPLSFLAVSTLLGSTAALPAAVIAGTGVQAVEPVVETWKRIPSDMPEVAIAKRNTLYDKNGAAFAQVWAEDRIEVKSLDDIAPAARNGLIATEDKSFYEHEGFDPKGTVRAALTGRGGGSGITQQLIKNLQFYNFLGTKQQKAAATSPTIGRKVHELKMAIDYEAKHSKDEILLSYFNTVAFGGPSVYGIETASQYFFGKPAKNLTIPEAAALVGTAQNPVIYNMSDPKKKAAWKSRQAEVLGRMVAEGKLSANKAKHYKAADLKFAKKPNRNGTCAQSSFPFYCTYTMDYLAKNPRLGATQEERNAVIAKGGLHIETYMDPNTMRAVDAYLKKNWKTNNRLIAPTAIVEPGTGGVTAFGVNRDYGTGKGKTQLVLPDRPAAEGSTYKMFGLAAALNSGMTEKDLDFSSQCPLRPGPNYDAPNGGFRNSNSCALQGGRLNYKQATGYSSNTWYVTLEMKIGVDEIKKFSKSVGLAAPNSINNRSLSYVLGSVGNSPIDVAAAYATFPNQGVYCPATPVAAIRYENGTEPALPDTYDPSVSACRSVMSPKNAGIVLKALRANVSGEVPKAFGIKSRVAGQDTGAKSGTNEGYNSAWAHVSGYYSLYTNVYDQENTARGLAGGVFRGRSMSGNTAQTTGGEIMASVLRGKKLLRMTYDSPETEFKPNLVDQSAFFVMPSVIGMKPEEAVGVLRSLGVKVQVDKKTTPAPPGYPAGIVASQSVDPGFKLARGTGREVILKLAQ